MNKKRILLIGGNFSPEQTGIGKYNGEMVEWLGSQGFDCSVITTFPYYPFWKIQHPYKKNSGWYKKEIKPTSASESLITVYRCPHYVPSNPSGFNRILSDVSFFISAFFQLVVLMFHKKYDYTFSVVPPFQLGLLSLLYKFLRGGKVIYHIQDLQIDAAHSLGMIKSKLAVRVMFKLERFIIKNSDYVSSISDGMIGNIMAKYNREVLLCPNWANTQDIFPIENKAELKREFGIPVEKKVVLYSGAIGEKQGLDMLLHCAQDLKADTQIVFVICGSGPYKERLIHLAEHMNLSNVLFLPLQPKEKFNNFLNMADIHLVLQKADATDLVMPSKVTNILSVGGLALITTPENNSLHSLISRYNMGILIMPENQALLTEAIVSSLMNNHEIIRDNARTFAEENLTMENILTRYLSQLTSGRNLVPEKVNLPAI